MNKTVKILSIVLTIIAIALLVFTIAQPVVFAEITPGSLKGSSVNTTEMQTVGNRIIGFIRAGGIIVSVIMLMVIGIKYMLGSAEEKAEYKKSLMPYVIGAVLLLTASVVAGAIYNAVYNVGSK